MKTNTVCIIPARGGSKRIPKKNIKDFFGKPLIAYSIEVAKSSNLFSKIIVSTDDKKIANISIQYGAEVINRPKELADDFTGTDKVISHAIEYLKNKGYKFNFLCTLYPTAPLLQKEYLIQGLETLLNCDAKYSFSATSMPFPIQRTFKINNNGRCEMFTPEHYLTRSQDLEEAYQDAGQFYWTRLDKKNNKIMFGKDSIPIILPRYLVQDLDTQEDWERLEIMYQTIYQNKYDKWNNLKKKLANKNKVIKFSQGNIYFMSVGHNIGYEIYGHDDLFLRPVLVYRKLSSTSFIGIPLTSKQKEGNYYFTFRYTDKTLSTACLNQIRTFDIKRAEYYDGYIKLSDYSKLRDKLKEFLTITPNLKKKGNGHASKRSCQKINAIIPKEKKVVK